MEQTNFDVAFQRSILRLSMLDEAFCHRIMKYVDVSFFTTETLGWVFNCFQQYHAEYNGPCTEIAVNAYLAYLSVDERNIYGPEVNAVLAMGNVPEEQFIKDKLQEFVRRNMFVQTFHNTQEHFNNTQDVNSSVDSLMQSSEEIQQVTFDAPDRTWFFEDFKHRQYQRIRDNLDPTRNTITTGLPEFDDIIGGGISIGELMIIQGLPKVGKTTWLINMGLASTRIVKAPTLYCNYEGPRALIENRFDASFANTVYNDVKRGNISSQTMKLLLDEYQYSKKLLVIRSFAKNWDNTAETIISELADLKALGFVPKLIIVDYADLLRSRHKGVVSETAHQTDAMKDLKQVANRGYAVWTACQGQRPRNFNLEDPTALLKSNMIADAYAKIRIADGYGSLNATREEKGNNTCRLFWEDYRDNPVGRLFRLHNQNDKMILGDRVEEIGFDEQ
jgi:replicative DNA helicase